MLWHRDEIFEFYGVGFEIVEFPFRRVLIALKGFPGRGVPVFFGGRKFAGGIAIDPIDGFRLSGAKIVDQLVAVVTNRTSWKERMSAVVVKFPDQMRAPGVRRSG